jgi:hypothetical protein
MSLHAAVALHVVGDLLAVALMLGCSMQLLTLLGFLLGGGRDGGSDSDDGGGGGGGGGDRPLDRQPGGGGHFEPAWWAQFEQDFAEYSRASRQVQSAQLEESGAPASGSSTATAVPAPWELSTAI